MGRRHPAAASASAARNRVALAQIALGRAWCKDIGNVVTAELIDHLRPRNPDPPVTSTRLPAKKSTRP